MERARLSSLPPRLLQALHEIVGGVHMDMKPQQLLIDDNGRGKVNDFNGIHLMGSSPDGEGEFCPTHAGKPIRMVPWRSPENVAGEVRERIPAGSVQGGRGFFFISPHMLANDATDDLDLSLQHLRSALFAINCQQDSTAGSPSPCLAFLRGFSE